MVKNQMEQQPLLFLFNLLNHKYPEEDFFGENGVDYGVFATLEEKKRPQQSLRALKEAYPISRS